jgi:hypothetical protein
MLDNALSLGTAEPLVNSIINYIAIIFETAISTTPVATATTSFGVIIILSTIMSNLFFNPNEQKRDLEVIGAPIAAFGPSTIVLGISLNSPLSGYWTHTIPFLFITLIGMTVYMHIVIAAEQYRRDKRVAAINPPYDISESNN